jgi:hypothetical protein
MYMYINFFGNLCLLNKYANVHMYHYGRVSNSTAIALTIISIIAMLIGYI